LKAGAALKKKGSCRYSLVSVRLMLTNNGTTPFYFLLLGLLRLEIRGRLDELGLNKLLFLKATSRFEIFYRRQVFGSHAPESDGYLEQGNPKYRLTGALKRGRAVIC
jgi:hypothetical protein